MVDIYFNRPVQNISSTYGNTFTLYDFCGNALSAPSGWSVSNDSSSAPYKVTLSWTTGYENQALRVKVAATGAGKVVDSSSEVLDGNISDMDDSVLPSGDGTIANEGANTDVDAEFVLYSLEGDVDGDRDIDITDKDLLLSCYGQNRSCWVPCDLSNDTNINMSDLTIVLGKYQHYWINTTADENDGSCSDGDCSLRDAITLATGSKKIAFDIGVFPPCNPATIAMSGSDLPNISTNYNTIDASSPVAGVILDGSAVSGSGITFQGDSNKIKGLQIINFADGVYIGSASNTVGGSFDASAANGLGEGCRISSNTRGD